MQDLDLDELLSSAFWDVDGEGTLEAEGVGVAVDAGHAADAGDPHGVPGNVADGMSHRGLEDDDPLADDLLAQLLDDTDLGAEALGLAPMASYGDADADQPDVVMRHEGGDADDGDDTRAPAADDALAGTDVEGYMVGAGGAQVEDAATSQPVVPSESLRASAATDDDDDDDVGPDESCVLLGDASIATQPFEVVGRALCEAPLTFLALRQQLDGIPASAQSGLLRHDLSVLENGVASLHKLLLQLIHATWAEEAASKGQQLVVFTSLLVALMTALGSVRLVPAGEEGDAGSDTVPPASPSVSDANASHPVAVAGGTGADPLVVGDSRLAAVSSIVRKLITLVSRAGGTVQRQRERYVQHVERMAAQRERDAKHAAASAMRAQEEERKRQWRAIPKDEHWDKLLRKASETEVVHRAKVNMFDLKQFNAREAASLDRSLAELRNHDALNVTKLLRTISTAKMFAYAVPPLQSLVSAVTTLAWDREAEGTSSQGAKQFVATADAVMLVCRAAMIHCSTDTASILVHLCGRLGTTSAAHSEWLIAKVQGDSLVLDKGAPTASYVAALLMSMDTLSTVYASLPNAPMMREASAVSKFFAAQSKRLMLNPPDSTSSPIVSSMEPCLKDAQCYARSLGSSFQVSLITATHTFLSDLYRYETVYGPQCEGCEAAKAKFEESFATLQTHCQQAEAAVGRSEAVQASLQHLYDSWFLLQGSSDHAHDAPMGSLVDFVKCVAVFGRRVLGCISVAPSAMQSYDVMSFDHSYLALSMKHMCTAVKSKCSLFRSSSVQVELVKLATDLVEHMVCVMRWAQSCLSERGDTVRSLTARFVTQLSGGKGRLIALLTTINSASKQQQHAEAVLTHPRATVAVDHLKEFVGDLDRPYEFVLEDHVMAKIPLDYAADRKRVSNQLTALARHVAVVVSTQPFSFERFAKTLCALLQLCRNVALAFVRVSEANRQCILYQGRDAASAGAELCAMAATASVLTKADYGVVCARVAALVRLVLTSMREEFSSAQGRRPH